MKSSPLKATVFWLAVILPLGWGVYKSATKSLPLFQQTPPNPPARPA
jgi:hypothetical protein